MLSQSIRPRATDDLKDCLSAQYINRPCASASVKFSSAMFMLTGRDQLSLSLLCTLPGPPSLLLLVCYVLDTTNILTYPQ